MLRSAILVAVLVGVATANDYCRVCSDHTMCRHDTTSPGTACRNFQARPLSQADKNAVVHAHNALRNKVALGQETQGPRPQPAASDMRRLYWDDEVAAIAQRWANQCNFSHDKCRNTKDGVANGQNLFTLFSSGNLGSVNWAGAVQRWYDEVKQRDGSLNTQGYRWHAPTGHYTQVAWARTSRVGCGYSDYTQNGRNTRIIVCNYKQSGNFIGQPMYQGGQPASRCPSGTRRDATYTGLCA